MILIVHIRALVVKKRKIVKLGHGIYAKLNYSELVDQTYLPKGFVSIVREALTRLGIQWDISDAEKAYNKGQTQQIPADPQTKVWGRLRRKISYKGMEPRFEIVQASNELN